MKSDQLFSSFLSLIKFALALHYTQLVQLYQSEPLEQASVIRKTIKGESLCDTWSVLSCTHTDALVVSANSETSSWYAPAFTAFTSYLIWSDGVIQHNCVHSPAVCEDHHLIPLFDIKWLKSLHFLLVFGLNTLAVPHMAARCRRRRIRLQSSEIGGLLSEVWEKLSAAT